MHSLIRLINNSKTTNLCFIFNYLLWLLSVTTAFGTHSFPTEVTNAAASASSVLFRSRSRSGVYSSTVQLVTSLEGGYDIASIDSFPKSLEQNEFIKKALLKNVMFTNLPKTTLDRLIGALEQTTVNKDDVIVKQGQICDVAGEYVYLVADGECTVIVDGKVVPEPYGTLKPGAIFGELGVLYSQTRAATINAKSDTVSLFRVKGETFKSFLNSKLLLSFNDDPELLEQIDQAINQVAGTKSLYGGDIIRQYKPNRAWLWSRWTGTVFLHNYKTVLGNMLVSLAFIFYARRVTGSAWSLGMPPDKTHPFIQRLNIIRQLWTYMMSLTTFILTFFLNQAYSFWQDVHSTTRGIQGRLNDFNLLLATSAKRKPEDGTYTPESRTLLDDIGASSRLFHALFWASCTRRFSILNTQKGMERLASRGLMTSRQLQVLEGLDVSENQRHNACIEWMMIRAWQGIDDGTLRSNNSLSDRLMDQMCKLRGTYSSIGDKVSCRMPLPYAHLVQILVDSFIALSSVALYPDLGAYSVVGVGVLTLFYSQK